MSTETSASSARGAFLHRSAKLAWKQEPTVAVHPEANSIGEEAAENGGSRAHPRVGLAALGSYAKL